MSKESTKAAFARATGHLLLNLSPEEEASITEYGKSEGRIRQEALSDRPRYPTYDERIRQLQPRRSAHWKARLEGFRPARRD